MPVASMNQLFFSPSRFMSIGVDGLDRYFLSLNPALEPAGFGGSLLTSVGSLDLGGDGPHKGGCSCGECMGGGKTFLSGDSSIFAPNYAPDVVPGDTTSVVTLTLGTYTAGEIDTLGDHDWYRVTLTAGQTYTFSIDPSGPGGAVTDVEDSYLRLRNSAGTLLAEDDDGGLATHSNLTFTATTTGTYFVDVGTYNDGETGTFRVLAANAGTSGADTVAAFSGTTGTIAIGGTVNSAINTVGDQDWYAVTLTAGQRYEFRTSATGGAGDVDTVIFIRNAAGAKLASNDDGNGGSYSKAVYTPSTTGTYYVNVAAFANASSGNYRLTADLAPPLQAYTFDQIADQLINGYWGGSGNARRFNVAPGGTITFNVQALTAAGQTLAREALLLWTDATGIIFNEITTAAQMTFDDNQDGAFASSTRVGNFITSSQINVSTQWLTTYGTGLNTYSFQTYIHEIGHAIGLGHAGNYNGSADYAADALYLNDAWATTVMSYFDQTENTYFGGLGFTRQFVVSPIVGDVLATNTMYGTPTTTRTGNTTYGFNNNSGRTIYDANTYPSVTYTVVDHGGTDTMDYSGFSQNQRIDLNAEAFSNIGARVGNVTIARGTVIENAIGGSGNDTLIGNAVGNVLDGGTGVSTLTGNAGNDRLIIRSGAAGSAIDGGTDTDTLVVNATTTSLASLVSIEAVELAGGAVLTLTGSQFIVGLAANTQFSGTGSVIVNLGTVAEFAPTAMTVAGGSTITFTINGDADSEIIKVPINIASIINGGDGPDQIRGSNLADTINGGNGVDKILGLSGADLLTGGADMDQFRYYFATDAGLAAAGDTITDFVSGTDKLDFRLFDADLGTAGQQNVSYVGTAAFTGGGNRQVRWEDLGADLRVEVDSNGDGVADMHILLQGAGTQTLTAGDFLFV